MSDINHESCGISHQHNVAPQQFARIVGVNIVEVLAWIRSGLPTAGCKKCHRLNHESGMSWLRDNGKLDAEGKVL